MVRGTAAAERSDLLGGNDFLDAIAGDDCVLGGAGAGADRVFARDGRTDTVDCDPGTDTVVGDPTDALRNRELVTRPV